MTRYQWARRESRRPRISSWAMASVSSRLRVMVWRRLANVLGVRLCVGIEPELLTDWVTLLFS